MGGLVDFPRLLFYLTNKYLIFFIFIYILFPLNVCLIDSLIDKTVNTKMEMTETKDK